MGFHNHFIGYRPIDIELGFSQKQIINVLKEGIGNENHYVV
jgi:hypothetical protein